MHNLFISDVQWIPFTAVSLSFPFFLYFYANFPSACLTIISFSSLSLSVFLSLSLFQTFILSLPFYDNFLFFLILFCSLFFLSLCSSFFLSSGLLSFSFFPPHFYVNFLSACLYYSAFLSVLHSCS